MTYQFSFTNKERATLLSLVREKLQKNKDELKNYLNKNSSQNLFLKNEIKELEKLRQMLYLEQK